MKNILDVNKADKPKDTQESPSKEDLKQELQRKIEKMSKIMILTDSQIFIQREKKFYENLINFIDSENDVLEEFIVFQKYLDESKFGKTQDELVSLLQILSKLSANRVNSEIFRQKIEKILSYYEIEIKQTLSNEDLFVIFRNNKLILLYLLKNNLMAIDDTIIKFVDANFFYPEINDQKGIEKVDNTKNDDDILFDQKRSIGENDSYVCHLIRYDAIDEFSIYVTQTNLSLNYTIKPSIFESNHFLIERMKDSQKVELIEYAAFFGSIQIINFLINNKIKMVPSLWLFAIHSRNADLIHLLERHKVHPPMNNYVAFLHEALLCGYEEMADYFQNNLEGTQSIQVNICYESSFTLNYLLQYDYYALVNLYNHSEINNVISKKNKITVISAKSDNYDIVNYPFLESSIENELVSFENSEIKEFVIPSRVKKIDQSCFKDCETIEKVVIPSSVTELGDFAFFRCTALTEVTFEQPSSVTVIPRHAFYGCKSLTELIIPPSVTLIEESAFFGCSSLKMISIPESVTEIRHHAFCDCKSLQKIEIPSTVTGIKRSTFCRCSSLNDISIPSSVAEIEEFAFYGCASLKNLRIPISVKKIGDMTFNGCTSLEKLSFSASAEINELGVGKKVEILRF